MQRWRLALLVLSAFAASLPTRALAQNPGESAPRGAMGILIRNPDTARGEPPFAVADQYGKVQRLVEPSPGMSLDRLVGQRVRIKHDTGHTLLASQLELPNAGAERERSVQLSRDELRPVSSAQFIAPKRDGRPYQVIPAQLTDDDATIDRGAIDRDAADSAAPIDLDRLLAEEGDSLPAPMRGESLEPIPADDDYYPESVSIEPMDRGMVGGGGHDPDCPHCREKARRQRATNYEPGGYETGGCPQCAARSTGPFSRCQSCGLSDGWCGPTCSPASRRGVYGRADYLLWWFDGMNTPPLATTNDLGGAPILGNPGTRVVYGGELLDDPRSGLRFTLGAWLDDRRDLAIEGDWMFFETETDAFHYNDPTGLGILGRPFYNIATVDAQDNVVGPAEDVQIIAFNGQAGGSLDIVARSEFQSFGLRLRTGICCRELGGCQDACGCSSCTGGGLLNGRGGGAASGISRIDFIAGYRFYELEERLAFNERDLTFLPSTGTVNVNDRFDTNNEFHGVDLGFIYDLQSRRWGLELASKIAVGGTHQRVIVDGSTSSGSGTATVTTPGGLLAQTSNIGYYSRDRFSVIPELSARLSYRVTQQLSLSAGYTLLYWANVVRPGDIIDTSVDGRLASDPLATATAGSHPRFDWDETSLWAHGLNFGLDYNY
ncbi:hypothetical protein Pla108_16470 [Botrimarina colliarenosi]|uniref:Outer membrane protein beta-barrel domain-containing protein n=1 Tax=Botrimarina colliarenosi TaxID=2528001 RepID=A0A5C6AKY8_9BACT|nr:BBP7 family outer membrane beta-barrel protein [Botrimarina colliarenosi]TWU00695.1 hypothetical protein Pla108_16470 [Botrimarina colliarenosi]